MALPHSRTVIVRGSGEWRAVTREVKFGYPQYTTVSLPARLFSDLPPEAQPDLVRPLQTQFEFKEVGSPLQHMVRRLGQSIPADATQQALHRLEAAWLLAEDRLGLLDIQQFEPLPHQLSLVQHVVTTPHLKRVLIADEVGLGKTIETALIVQRLAREKRGERFRALYLTQARLVDNVAWEFGRVGVTVKRWAVNAQEATLDPDEDEGVVVASFHRAVASDQHFARLEASGPWDLLVVDEAHHLTDWSEDGGDPQRRMRLARKLLADRMRPDSRLILLTGTPHQGHAGRFKNVLKLLDEGLKDERKATGRVIYRIKEDIRGWNDEPLFPARNVLPPTVLNAPPDYKLWLESVSSLLSSGTSRAHSWRRTQALQWCASSPQAGLGYLVRMALRSGLRAHSYTPLRAALEALRPYREGSPDEGLEALEARLLENDEVPEAQTFERAQLQRVIALGVSLVRGDAVGIKIEAILERLDNAPGEKFVVFAQPVDTVYFLYRRLEDRLGKGAVSLIVGGQSGLARDKEISRFRRPTRCRVLVSSRSGGEGINLQVSRNLVHFDVPWNPMELEQRVGRVHRYGGFQTVNVHTLLLSGSREERVLARCRAVLASVVRDLDQSRFELLFARTMSMIPTEDLEHLMLGEDLGPLKPNEGARLDLLVQAGVKDWQSADQEFRDISAKLPDIRRGPVSDDDLASFLSRTPGFAIVAGTQVRSPGSTMARTFRLSDGTLASTGRGGADAAEGVEPVKQVGLNSTVVLQAVRDAVRPPPSEQNPSIASIRLAEESWKTWVGAGLVPDRTTEFVILLAYLVCPAEPDGLADRSATYLRAFLLSCDGVWRHELNENAIASVVRAIAAGTAEDRVLLPLAEQLLHSEAALLSELGAGGVFKLPKAVFPIVAVVIRRAAPSLRASTPNKGRGD
jgi:superfamily II DNA or RNA helicase